MHRSRPTSCPLPPASNGAVSRNGSSTPNTWSVVEVQRAPAAVARPRRVGLLLFLIWSLFSLGTAAQYYFFPNPDDFPNPDFGLMAAARALGLGFALWYSWGLLGLFAFRLAQRFPLEAHHWPKRLAIHVVACLAFAAVKIAVDYPIIRHLYCPRPHILTFPVFVFMGLRGPFLRYILYYWATIGACHALDYYGKYRGSELRAARLETGLTRARLQLLKTQLQPHFVFNTLNAISALVHVDVEGADRMLARLGDLLRLALEDFGVQEAPLARELEIARSYLEIQQARLGPRLHVEWDIAADLGEALVPTFLLQPLIENAIHHGIAPRSEPGRLAIRARRQGAELHLEVSDDGPGLAEINTAKSGVGLANTRARLLHLYGTAQGVELRNGGHIGCVARVILPFREPAAGAAENGEERHNSYAHRR